MKSNLLYIGSLDKKSNSYRRFLAYSEFLNKVDGIDIDKFIYASYTKNLDHFLNFGLGTLKLNFLLRKIDYNNYDFVIVDNRPFLFGYTLKHIKKVNSRVRIINVLTDDPNGKYKKGWRLLKNTAAKYDLHFVQRKINILELYNWGANQVEISFRSFEPKFHRKKFEIQKDMSFQVGFIGSYEEEREQSIKFLIDNGIQVNITGDGWEKGKYFNIIQSYYTGPSVYGDNYVDKINSMPIALHFLRKGNRDEQDSRTFEIPSCGTPMIAEYSEVHASLFLENKEVLFFRSDDELLEKVNELIRNPQYARELALAALKRCYVSGYDHLTTCKRVLNIVSKSLD
jgi:spore maturation protein CgeB